MNEVELRVTVDEANLILEGLGLLPFAKVYALVAKIQKQASQQLNGAAPAEPTADASAGAPAAKLGESADED